MPQTDTKKGPPTRTMAPLKAVKFALEELEPDADLVDFSDLIEAAIRLQTPGATLARTIAHHLDVDDRVMRDWARGVATPNRRVQREVVAFAREHLKLCRMG